MRARGTWAGLLLLVSTSAMPQAPFAFESTPGRLPKTIVPVEYAVRIAPDIGTLTFDGEVAVRIDVRKAAKALVLNARNLEIRSASLSGGAFEGRPLAPTLDAKQQTVSFALKPALPPGEYRLDIAFGGHINRQSQGLYLEHYKTARGDSPVLVTQMEPVEARTVLPCWDEPAFRASFELTVDLPASMVPVSNMPVASSQALPGERVRTRFLPTPKMPSYLLVLVAGELERVAHKQDGIDLGIVTAKGRLDDAGYALASTRALMRFYTDYFGTPYPLPKLDQIGVPPTAGFGAMENWGGIVYDEQILLFDDKTSPDRNRRAVHDVVAHEIAHQWFGNLVTMAWWDNLWLNEGFASWMGTKAADRLNPDWKVWQVAHRERERAMQLDARKTTHPIQQAVPDEAATNDAFDVITYLKGQAFLRMLETWLGEAPFRAGIRRYIQRHAYSNTTTTDLWAALEEASGNPVKRMAARWTEQPGFPVVKVNAKCEKGTRRITFKQEQFKTEGEPGDRLWTIPVAVASGSTKAYELLERRWLTVLRPGCDGPVVIDPDGVGFFRVQYSDTLLAQVANAWTTLSEDARLKVLSDAWALAGTGRTKLPPYLDLLQRARNDSEPQLWSTIREHLYKLDQLARGEPGRPALRRFAIEVLQPRFAALGWEPRDGEPQPVRELRAELIAALGRLGDPAVVAEAQARFARYLENPASLPGALVDAVVGVAGQHADAATFDALVGKMRSAQSAEERRRFTNALASGVDPALAQRALAMVLDESLSASLATVIPKITGREHVALTWAWARDNHAALQKRVNAMEANHYFGDLVASAADARLADEFEAWAARHLPPGAKTMTQRLADQMRVDAQLKKRLLPQLEKGV